MSHLIDHRKILFWGKALNSDSTIIRTMATINKYNIGLIIFKHGIPYYYCWCKCYQTAYLDAVC